MKELRSLLDETQTVFGERWGVIPDQISEWELGKSKPPRSRIELAAKRNGWPLSWFQQAGPHPTQGVMQPLRGLGYAKRSEAEGFVARPREPVSGALVRRALASLDLARADLLASLEQRAAGMPDQRRSDPTESGESDEHGRNL